MFDTPAEDLLCDMDEDMCNILNEDMDHLSEKILSLKDAPIILDLVLMTQERALEAQEASPRTRYPMTEVENSKEALE
jgi:hypothetical protein